MVISNKTGKVKLTNETKTGQADYTPQQKRYYEDSETVTLTGKKSGTAKGQQINTSNTTSRTARVKREDIDK